MAVYLFTFHAYRSWRPDNPHGYVKRGEGIQPSDSRRAAWYDLQAKHPPRRFADDAQEAIVAEAGRLAESETWRLHYVCATPTHVHTLVSWHGFRDWNEVRVKLKRNYARVLSKALDQRGPWFSRGGRDSRVRVTDRDHFDYLMQQYLPKRSHHGLHFREGCRAAWRNP